MSNKKKKKSKKEQQEMEEKMPAVDRHYEDVPLSKNDPIMKVSQEIQRAHTMGFWGMILSIVVPFIGLFVGIFGFIKCRAVSPDVPREMMKRYSAAKALCKASIAVGILMMGFIVIFISTGGLSRLG